MIRFNVYSIPKGHAISNTEKDKDFLHREKILYKINYLLKKIENDTRSDDKLLQSHKEIEMPLFGFGEKKDC